MLPGLISGLDSAFCPLLWPPTGGNRIKKAVLGAHDGGLFALCALRDGTLVSGGGRDRRVVLWGSDYCKLHEVEVRRGSEGSPTPTRQRARDPPPSPPHPNNLFPSSVCSQVPEDFGPVRTVAEGRGDTLYVGTTRNSILQGSLHVGFSLLVQVSVLGPPPWPTPVFSSHLTLTLHIHLSPYQHLPLPWSPIAIPSPDLGTLSLYPSTHDPAPCGLIASCPQLGPSYSPSWTGGGTLSSNCQAAWQLVMLSPGALMSKA